jgi:hypothetical protein
MEAAEPQPREFWKRQPGEPRHQYAAFELYRDLGPMRTYANAIRAYLEMDLGDTSSAKKGRIRQTHSQQRYRQHPDPDRYVYGFVSHWQGRWAKVWHWEARCDAFDAYRELLAAERNYQERLRQEEDERAELARWRKRQMEGHKGVQEAGLQVFTRLLELMRSGKVRELEWAGIIPLVPIALRALTDGQEMEIKHIRDLIKAEKLRGDMGTVLPLLLATLKEFVAEEKWADLGARLIEIEQNLRRSTDALGG